MKREDMERKSVRARALKTDAKQGVVEHIVALCGNIDLGDDRIKSGAFTKTIAEQGLKVRVLDQHRTDSIMAAIGRPLSLREAKRAELPEALLEDYPEATGALIAKTQFLMGTPEGKGAFIRIDEGAVDEYSFGYDPLDVEYETLKIDGEEKTVRNLLSIRLWEYGPVLWGMNEATRTLNAKQAAEQKPWDVFVVDGEYCVHKTDADGGKTGSALGCHPNRPDANAQMRALYANEAAGKGPDETNAGSDTSSAANTPLDQPPGSTQETGGKEWSVNGPQQRLGDVLQGSVHKTFTLMCDHWLVEGMLDREERIALSGLIGAALDVLSEGIPAEIADRPVCWYEYMSAGAPPETPGAALKDPTKAGAGPEPNEPPPTFVTLAEIEAEMREIEFLEVGS